MICPWNRYGQLTDEADFSPRAALHAPELTALFQWDEAKFLRITEGSPIRRIGYQRWSRNIAVALGNAPWHTEILSVLEQRRGESDLLDEHIEWAITQQLHKRKALAIDVQPAQQKRLVRVIEKGLPRDA